MLLVARLHGPMRWGCSSSLVKDLATRLDGFVPVVHARQIDLRCAKTALFPASLVRDRQANDQSSSVPVLSPKLSLRTPTLSSMPSSRFAIGVCGGATMWRLPGNRPDAP